ncbi:MFS general substrate transporter [Aspergillus steynii IBT 23096]|uniref:MFS general substrate transporter n=1 Tax=Aspergillus steynii IBT 23096 TaxID=1392250 RepID=A0A2I2G117_9EURO|nr:MFS general substrate transporter [Aspergillus steynii IBT 23096]PLB46584.1 MFS general substrate transporter [Aspergillus steynii IBT 23096]
MPWGYSWRSSTGFIVSCISIALFAEAFLYSFVVPILPYILEDRNHVSPSAVQRLTYQVLTLYGAVAVVAGILIGHVGDRIKSRRVPLILGLGLAFAGTLLLAISTRLYGVFIGRTLQAIGGVTAWIIGYATLRDSIQSENMGKTFGLVNALVSAGALSGPAIAGLLLQVAGYWITWSVVLAVLIIDIIMRVIMIEKPKMSKVRFDGDGDIQHRASDNNQGPEYTSEQSPLLRRNTDISAASFYRIILGQPRVIVGLLSYMLHSSLIASYNTTLPIHVKQAFGWGSLPAGLCFLALQAPAIIFSPLFGWLRDKIGTRTPTALGFILLAPLLWLLGAAHKWDYYRWIGSEKNAKTIYIVAIVCIGCFQNLLTSVGTIEITCTVDELQEKHPGIFGPHGGYSRSYSLSNISFTMGFLVGPLLSGALTDSLGYSYMNLVLACICVAMSLLAFTFLKGKSSIQSRRSDNASD